MRTTSYIGTTLNDQYAGGEGPNGNLDNFGRGGSRYLGIRGLEIELDDKNAVQFTRHMNNGVTYYAGRYQYVKSLSSSSATPARGTVAYMSTVANDQASIVTPDVPTNAVVAGVYLGTVTKGYYTWIQTAGLASVLFKATSLTVASAVGLPVVAISASSIGRGDTRAIASAFTFGDMLTFLGSLAETAVADAISLIQLFPYRNRF